MRKRAGGLAATALMLVGALSGCSSSRPCRDGTLFVTVDLGTVAMTATHLDVDVSLNDSNGGAVEKTFHVVPGRPLAKTESLEIDLPKTLVHPTAAVTVTAYAADESTVAQVSTLSPVTVSGSCLALPLSLVGPDIVGTGGAGGGGGGIGGATGAGGGISAGSGGRGAGGAGATGGTAATATGGVASTGGTGVGGTAGKPGSGGAVGTGGAGTGGAKGSGGIVGTGGTAPGSGGTTAACAPSATQCATGGLQTCGASGQWGAAVACGSRQTCAGPSGTAKCACNTDPVCTGVGSACASTSMLAACAQDANGCFYPASSMSCTNGACSGTAPAAACCTNACTLGAMQSSGCGTQMCQTGVNGCTAWTTATSACGAPLVCERYAGPVCANADWAEWPATAASPASGSYTDNGDQTVTDKVTGLMWQKTSSTTTYTQPNAVAYCPTLTLGGHSDWRLPSEIELLSIVDYGASSAPKINSIFTGTQSSVYWSSTLVAGAPSGAWFVAFSYGSSSNSAITVANYVRCVR